MAEVICKSYTSDKGQYLKDIKNSYRSITKNPVKKRMENLKRHFPKEDIQIANRYIKRCSTSLIIRKTQVKTKLKYECVCVSSSVISNSF